MWLLGLVLVTASLLAVSAQPSGRCPGSPNQCSLHGSCVINRLGEFVCNCQWGYHGNDCSKKMCPHGVDPMTDRKNDKKIRLVVSGPPSLGGLTTSAASQYALQGKLVLTFHAHSVEMEMPLGDMTSDACTRVFRRFQNFADVSCERVEFNAPASATFEITMHSFPVYPVMNNLYRHDGNPGSNEFWCDGSDVQVTKNGSPLGLGVGIQCSFQSVSDSQVRPYDACSKHGVCSDRTGLCTCEEGFYGDNCANNKDEEDILVAPSTGPFFQGNVLRVSTKRDKSTEFNLIKADIAGATVFSMDGMGDTVFHEGSVYLKDGDLVVQDGQVRINKGGALVLDGADIKLQNGRMHVVATEDTSSLPAATEPLLRLDTHTATSAADFLRLTKQSSVVFRVTSSGTVVVHDGGIEVLKGGVKVHGGGLQILSGGVQILQGGINIGSDGVQVRRGDVNIDHGSVSVKSSSKKAIQVEGTMGGSLISASVSGVEQPMFEVLGSGETRIHSGGLKVAAGGVDIASGGQIIHAGGLTVKSGGVVVETGSVTTRGGFNIEDGGLSVRNNAINGAILSLSSSHTRYAGSMIEFVVNQSVATDPPYRLLEAVDLTNSDGIPDTIVAIQSDGTITTRGDIMTLDKGRIISEGALVSKGQMVFSHVKILAGDVIEIPATISYVRVTDDGEAARNIVKLDTTNAYAGQLLVIQNEDAQSLEGDVSVKPTAAAIFVFDGRDWRALTAASFDTSTISGVKSFEAANDLNFGEIKLTVNNLQVASQRAGYVAVYGKGGELSQAEQLKFDSSLGLLSVDKLDAHSITGRIDMTQSELVGVEIVGGHISNVNMTDIEMVEVSGELFVENQAFFGAGIMVDGQVMGSGAYIDASDERFKTDIEPIDGDTALEWISQLRAVEYSYRLDEFPHRKFSERREVGFVAQQVERVLPEVVEHDADGYKYVAYARIVPIVAEAVKQVHHENQMLRDEVDRLRREVQELRELVLQAVVG